MSLLSLLDITAARLADDRDPFAVMTELGQRLNDLRSTVTADEWISCVKPVCLSHPLRQIVHQDPYTQRAFAKPRGYAGDAVMLDYVYSGTPPEGTTELGKKVFRCTTRLSNGLSVIERRNYLAGVIDRTAREVKDAQILSVACGHLRESQVSRAIRCGAVGTLYALDQDDVSLDVVREGRPKAANIITINASVKSLLRGRTDLPDLNLIYALGLYDYLTDAVARRLTATLFTMLAPGGRLVLANYTPDSQGRGYMETFMDWFLVYRDEVGLEACADDIPVEAIAERCIFRERHGNIVFAEFVRVS